MRFYKVFRKFQRLRVIYYQLISDNKSYGQKPERLQPILMSGKGKIAFGSGVKIGYYPSPLFFSTYAHLEARYEAASINIGNNTIINNNSCILAEYSSITIGERCFIGSNLEIMTSDFHGLQQNQRTISLPEWNAPVVIGDDVFIGNGVRILKGVSIGPGAVIASGAVVTRDVPASTVAAGNPARVIRHLTHIDKTS